MIEGAARGIGLGHAFLRHVERCHVIVHLVDATATDPTSDYLMVNEEILKYGSNSKLASIPQVVVVNKIDTLEGNNNNNNFNEESDIDNFVNPIKENLEMKLKEVMPHSRLMWMSAKNKDGVDDLMLRLAAFVKKVKDEKEFEQV